MAQEKKEVELEIYGSNTETKYLGRLLGLVTEEEYAGLVKNPELRTKLFTVETKSIKDVSTVENVENMRLAIALKKRNNEQVTRRTLFLTEQLDMLNNVVGDDDITFVGKNGSYMLLTIEGSGDIYNAKK
jgi:hypothetical protein